MRGSAIIKRIAPRGDGTACITLEVSNECGSERVELLILCELFEPLDLCAGDNVIELIGSLDELAEVTAAYFSGCASLAYTQGSLKGLYRKLVNKGFSREISLDATELIRSHGYIDEAETARRRAELMCGKLWGRTRILQKLREEGFPEDVMREVDEMLCEIDFSENCAKAIRKKYPCLPQERQELEKMCASLKRLGYSFSDIKKAIRSISDEE